MAHERQGVARKSLHLEEPLGGDSTPHGSTKPMFSPAERPPLSHPDCLRGPSKFAQKWGAGCAKCAPHVGEKVERFRYAGHTCDPYCFPCVRAFLSCMKQIDASAPTAPFQWMSCQQVADRLNCSRQHVYHLVRSGRLPAYNRGNGERRHLWRIKSTDVDAYELTGSTAGI